MGRTRKAKAVPPGVNGETRGELATAAIHGHWMTADRVTKAPVEWVIPGLIPRERLTAVVGEAHAGKSTLYARLIATHTKGIAWLPEEGGDARPPGNAILYTPEGADSDETLGRLRAAGADMKRVALGDVGPMGGRANPLILPDGIENALAKWQACRISLIVFDPIVSYFGSGASMMDGGNVRAVLEPLAHHAEAAGVTILVTCHYRKSRGGSPLDWIAGAAAWSQVPRHVVALGRDPQDLERRVIAAAKHSASRDQVSYTYTLQNAGGYGLFLMGERCKTTAEDLGQAVDGEIERDALADARSFLIEKLGEEEKRASELVRVGRELGLSERTLRRAKVALGITSHHAGQTGDRHMVWRKPESWPA